MTTPRPDVIMAPQVAGQDQQKTIQEEQTGMAASSPVQPAGTVASADHVLTLVSSSVVNQRGFANTCGVPLGAHLNLQPSSALRLPQILSRPPLRCNGCSAFLNVYCKTNLSKGVWKCNMCGAVNIQKEQLGEATDVAAYAELCSEAVEYVAPLPPSPSLSSPHLMLPPPGAASSPHLVFAVDATLEPRDLQAVREALLSLLTSPTLPPTALISLVTFDGCVAIHNLGPQRCSHVLPAGAAAPAPPGPAGASLDLQSAVQQLLDRHCTATAARRAGGAAAATSGGGGGALVSELASCASQLPRVLASLRTVQSEVQPRARARALCSAVEAALRLIAAAASLDLTRHHNLYGSRVVVLAGGPATRGPGAVPLELLDQAVPEKGRAPENRSVAAALDVGAALGDMAAKIGVPVDIFTNTSTGINARMLTAIAHGSGGELMTQQIPPPHLLHPHPQHAASRSSPSPSSSASPTPSALSTPQHSQQQQQQDTPAGGAAALAAALHGGAAAAPSGGAGGAGGFVGGLLSHQLAAALMRRFGLEGRLDCYCSEGLRLVQWLGPLDTIQVELEASAAAVAGPPAGGAAAAPAPASTATAAGGGGGSPYRLSSAACGVVALDAGRCASLRLEVIRDLDEVPALLLQVALHWVDPAARCRVVRVVTRRMSVVESRGEFLRTVNPVAAAALLGKRAVLEAKKAGAFRDSRRAEEARYAVAAQLGLVATRCGQEVQARRGVLGIGARKHWQWPPELMPLAYALYHFQRGPLLGPPGPPPPGTFPAAAAAHLHGLWDSDARLTGFNALLRAAWGDAYRAMAPKLYAVLPPSPPPPAAAAATSGGTDAQPALPPPAAAQLVALPCVSLAAVMARTAPLLLDVGTAVLVSPTEEPGGHGHDGGAGAAGELPAALLAAALQAVATSSASSNAAGAGADGPVGRFPVPSVVLAPGAQAGGGALAARLIPVHRDGYPEQAMQQPQLQQLGSAVAAQLSKQLTEGGAAAAAATAAAAAAAGLPAAQAKQAAAAAASFVEWCRGVHVQPFPAAAATS